MKDGSGEVVGAVAVASDVTERYLSEAALRKRVAELEAQLKTSPGPTIAEVARETGSVAHKMKSALR